MTEARTAAAFALLLIASPAAAQQASSGVSYKLTMPAIETCHAAMMNLLKRATTDPVIRAEQAKATQPEGNTPEQIAAFMKQQAPASSALMAANGCPAETYTRIGLASMEAMMALSAIEQKAPLDDVPAVARENAAFLQQNAARLQAIDAEASAAENAGTPTPPR